MMDRDSSEKLHRAIKRGDQTYVRAHIGSGGDVNARDSQGWTPVLRAASDGNRAILQLLLQSGARVEEGLGGGMTPLASAALGGHRDAIALLLSYGADPDPPPAGRLARLLEQYGPERAGILTMLAEARRDRDRAV